MIPDLTPIGRVRSPVTDPKKMVRGGVSATIELDPRYADALLNIQEHSHLWILTWFHLSDRETLQVTPGRLDPDAPTYGVFGLRANRRPNPIALSLVELVRVEGATLHVDGLDAVDGTPVLDIKSYFERDCVFSPKAPVLRPPERGPRYADLVRLARQHHRELCANLHLGARMALAAEERIGKLTSPELLVTVEGPRCLVDAIQGLTRARFANPARLTYIEKPGPGVTMWEKPGARLVISAMDSATGRDDWTLDAVSDEELFTIEEA
jgi:tRNA-Thr(GGU) m(6)t(6)A37 methyltransferase TsaA